MKREAKGRENGTVGKRRGKWMAGGKERKQRMGEKRHRAGRGIKLENWKGGKLRIELGRG